MGDVEAVGDFVYGGEEVVGLKLGGVVREDPGESPVENSGGSAILAVEHGADGLVVAAQAADDQHVDVQGSVHGPRARSHAAPRAEAAGEIPEDVERRELQLQLRVQFAAAQESKADSRPIPAIGQTQRTTGDGGLEAAG